jgi:hypothetical protein
MKKGVLITCPEHDDATAYLTYFSKQIVEEATNKSLKTKMITDKELNMETFSQIIEKLDYRLVVINGHGSPDSIFGYKNNVIIQFGKNDKILKERIVYARSCNAGITLGPECMNGTKEGCFVGYNLPFIFYMDEKWTTNPNNDKVAGLFLEPSNLVPISIIKGHTVLEAHNRAKKGMLKIMEKLLKSKQEEEIPFYLEALWNNYNGQIISGNNDAKL